MRLQITSAWQNAGLSAKLNFSPFYPPKAVCFCFFIKFTKRLTALATFRSELNFRSIQARTVAKPRNVGNNYRETLSTQIKISDEDCKKLARRIRDDFYRPLNTFKINMFLCGADISMKDKLRYKVAN